MSDINYRQQWAEGEIEAGTLLDAIDALAQRCRELVAALSRIYVRAKGYANENREMPEGSTFVVAEISGKALEAAACATTDGATPAA